MTSDNALAVQRRYKRKLRGWLSYAFASEVFVIVSLTLFLPICLEQFARDNGFLAPDRTIPCSSVRPSQEPNVPQGRCLVRIGWVWIDSASFSLYVYSISVALQALTVISMGGVADNPSHRKSLLLTFATIGSISATLFLFLPSTSSLWLLSALFAVLANIGFGASVVAMNAYLPSLARDSPDVQQALVNAAISADTDAGPSGDASEPLLRTSTPSTHHIREDQRLEYDTSLSLATSRISALGIALGYGSGIILLLLALVPVNKLQGSTWSLRLAIGLSGIWWAVFSIPAAIYLPSKEGPSREDEGGEGVWVDTTPNGEAPATQAKEELSLKKEIKAAWIRLGAMLTPREIKRLKHTFRYLAAWFLLSDGFTTITSTALLFAKTSLSMEASSLILIGVLTPLSGILGSLLWPLIQSRLKWSNLRILITLVVLASMIPLYGCLGFLKWSVFERIGFGGLRRPEEMFGLAVYFGMVYGAFQSYARAFYAELLPPGEEARWYGLFSITDKSSSFLGPLIVGLISDTTGNIRYSFFFLVFMIWLAIPILSSVDVEQGRKDAREYRYS